MDFDFDFDPFKSPDPFKSATDLPGFGGGHVRPQRAEYRRPLAPEESSSYAKQALGAGASGLSYILGSLDKPGQAVRGLLAGKGVGSLKHLVPFAHSMGLVGDEDMTSGRDLTDQSGLTDKNDKGWGAWGTGLAADIATDPLTYMTFGAKHALTAAGKVAQKAGTLRGLSREALIQGGHSGLARVGIPFGPSAVLGTGPVAQGIARGLDTAGNAVRFGNPVGRAWGALFDPSVGGAVDRISQEGFRKYGDPALQAAKATARHDTAGVLQQLDPLIQSGLHPEATITDAVRAVAEGVPYNFDPALAGQVQGLGQNIQDIGRRQIDEAEHLGLPLRDAGDPFANYVHRQALDVNHKSLQLGGRAGPRNLYPVTSGSNMGRDELLREIPGGTNRVNDWFKRFAGNPDQNTVAAGVLNDLHNDLLASGRVLTPDLANQFAAKSEAMAARLAHANEAYHVDQLPLFTPDLAADIAQRGAQHSRTTASARATLGTMGDAARPYSPGSGDTPLSQALDAMGLVTHEGSNIGPGSFAHEGALPRVYEQLVKRQEGITDPHFVGPLNAPALGGSLADLRRAADKFGLSPEHLQQIAKNYAKGQAPEQLRSPLAFLDSATNAFKSLAYPIWASSHVRNASTAGLNNATRGVGLADYGASLGLLRGTSTPNQLARYGFGSLDEARRELFTHANIFGGHGLNDDIADSAAAALRGGQGRFTPHAPGSDRTAGGNAAQDAANLVFRQGLLGSLGATARGLGGSAWNLFDPARRWGQSLGENLGIRGVAGATRDALPAVRAGRQVGGNIEDFFRGAQYLAEKRHGFVPSEAAEQVNRMHFDYDRVTDFEKKFMRRLVPFYTFASRNLPLQAETALTRPGLTNAIYKPFRQESDDQQGFVPAYLRSGVAMPTGPEVDGKRQYVSKLGLPAEEAFERLHFKNGLPDLGATAMDYMGQLNPLIKAPLEQLFDTQLHTQRRLSDLHAPKAASAIGSVFGEDNPQLLSQILANSPATRFITSADKLLDERKGWLPKAANLLTGVRVSDVDAEKSRAIELRQTLEEMMRGHPSLSKYTNFFVKPDQVGSLTPDEINMMRVYSELQDKAREHAKKNRALHIGIQG